MNPGESIEEEELVDSKGNLCGTKFILWYRGSVKKEWYRWDRTPVGCTKSLQKLEEKEMDDRYIECGYMTKLNMRRSGLICKLDDLLEEARNKFGEGKFSAATSRLRQIQKLLDKELPKRKAKK